MILIQRVYNWITAPYRHNKSRTVRYAFPLLFATAAFLGASVIDSETQSYITIESSESSVRAEELFTIDVYVSAHVPVNAVDINLTFPEAQIEILGIDTGESVITLWTEQPYVENNSVILRGGTFRKGFQGEHLIATINARANASGLATFEVSDVVLLAGDGSGSSVPVTENENELAKLYVANSDGTFTTRAQNGSGIEATVTVRIVTDIDGDGKVTLADISRFMAAWNSKNEVYDFSGDGRMTFKDFAIILADSFLR